jgi:hypothetical protein
MEDIAFKVMWALSFFALCGFAVWLVTCTQPIP